MRKVPPAWEGFFDSDWKPEATRSFSVKRLPHSVRAMLHVFGMSIRGVELGVNIFFKIFIEST